MKRMKKLMSIMLALVMVLAISMTVFAAEPSEPTYNGNILTGGMITIENAVVGETYNAYQILKLDSFDSAKPDNLIYKVSDKWENFALTDDFTKMFEVDEQGYVSLKSGVSDADNSNAIVAFAKAAAAYAKNSANSINANKTETVTAPADNPNAETGTVVFNNLPLGYYLIDTTLGTLCSLDTTNWNVTMTEKNKKPTNEKKIVENETQVDKNNVNIGDTVNYVSTITAYKGALNYVFHDDMSAGLTWSGEVTVKAEAKDGTPAESQLSAYSSTNTEDWDYKLVPDGENDGYNTPDTCDFHIEFNQTYLNTITEDTTITISYSAVLNENAVIGTNGNTNKSQLEYGNKPGNEKDETPWDEVTTYTYDFSVLKFTKGKDEAGEETEIPLSGAKFVLYKNAAQNENGGWTFNENDKVNLVKKMSVEETPETDPTESTPSESATESSVPTYQVCTVTNCSNHEHITEIETDSTGHFVIEGLDEGTYYLKETKAPDGYNTLKDPVKVTITDSITDEDGNTALEGTYEVKKDMEETAAENHQIKVENMTGTELPSTGGIGTTIFYVLGSILFVGAGILLIVKKRMSTEK